MLDKQKLVTGFKKDKFFILGLGVFLGIIGIMSTIQIHDTWNSDSDYRSSCIPNCVFHDSSDYMLEGQELRIIVAKGSVLLTLEHHDNNWKVFDNLELQKGEFRHKVIDSGLWNVKIVGNDVDVQIFVEQDMFQIPHNDYGSILSDVFLKIRWWIDSIL